MNYFDANSISSALTVLRPACFASLVASRAKSSPISSKTSASFIAASSLILDAPAFLSNLLIGAIVNSDIFISTSLMFVNYIVLYFIYSYGYLINILLLLN